MPMVPKDDLTFNFVNMNFKKDAPPPELQHLNIEIYNTIAEIIQKIVFVWKQNNTTNRENLIHDVVNSGLNWSLVLKTEPINLKNII